MQRLDAAIARPAAAQDGLATREQLRAAGLTNRAITLQLKSGLLRTLHPGVLHHAAVPYTHRTRLRAALLACGPTAVLSHRSAATLHQLGGIRRIRPELTVCDTTLPRLREVTIHRTDMLEAADLAVADGLPLTSVARTLLDLGAVLPFELVAEATSEAIIAKKVDALALAALLDRVGKRGRRGTASMRIIVREALPDERLQSVLERDLLALILRAGLPMPELQHRVVCVDGRVVILDFAWPAWRLAVEADGHRWHSTRKQLESDLARRRSIAATGWDLYSYGWGDVHDRAAAVVAELRSLSLSVPGRY